MAPDCPICGDFGWVTVEVPVGHPAFGKFIPCRCKQREEDATRSARLRHYSNMGPLARLTFEATRPQGRSPHSEAQQLFHKAYQQAMAFAQEPRGWLVLRGPSGSGKTHLAAAIANRAIEMGHPAFFVFVPDLLDHLRSTFTPTSEVSYDQLFERVRSAPLLILDDLGGHSGTPWAQEKLYQIMNHRYAVPLPTVFTLGLPLEEMEERWRTRLEDPEIATMCSLGTIGPTGALGQVGSLEPGLLQRMTFKSFDVRGNRASYQQRQSLEAALKMALNFAKTPEGWLVLLGPTGCGKTHLSVAIANERLKGGQEVLYFQVADLLDYLRVTFNPNSPVTYDQLFERVRTTPLLILEDFGSHHATPWAREKLHQIIVHRYDARLPTLFTTSEAEPDEEKRKDPLWSRLLDTTVVSLVPIDAPDYRHQGRSRPAGSS
ncbi:MAG: family ATPase [Dehalococcoidia bacterium]|nr:family ATPase [Dehalococcoidia bacterium]